MDMAYLEKVVFFYDFYGFGGLRSTQPTNYIRVLSYSKTYKEVRHLRKLRFRIMKRYPEYKESGVEWIGKIPHHWEVLKAKHVGSSNPSKNNPKTTCLKNEPVVFLPMERVHTDGTIDQELRLPYSRLKNGYTYFEEGDILIAKVTPCFENGKIVHIKNLATSVGFGSTEFIVIRPDLQKVFPPFLHYIFYNAPLRSIGKHFMTSAIGLKRVPTEFVESFRIPIPTYQEQTQIANFLDRKTEQIDELIRIKERQIELLQEQRTALINHTVTKGLDPNVEMKPSGVEWIGEIPAHWEIKKLKYVAKILPSNVDKHIYPDEIQVRLCNYTDVYYNDYITVDTVLKKGSCKESEFTKFALRKGDVIITKDSETPDDIGVPTYVKDDLNNVVCGYHLTMIKPLACRGEYIFRFIQSDRTRRYFELESNGITRYGLGKPSIENLRLPIPTNSEQRQIADFLDRKTEQINELIIAEQRKIELLKEYRQSLISEAVTGKIDVRNEV